MAVVNGKVFAKPAPYVPKSGSASEASLASFDARASQLQTDQQKMDAANERVKLQFGDNPRVSDKEYKEALETAYDSYDPEKSFKEMRGENAFTDFVSGAKEGIDSFNTAIGNVIDFGIDNIIGGGLEKLGAKEAGQTVRNWVTGEDLAILPDIATDVALTATGVGIPLMVAKNAIQLSPQIAQGISGKDAATGEQLDFGQQAANLAMGLGGVGLSLIPGVGKVRNIVGATSDAVAKANQKVAKEGLEAATKAAGDATIDASTKEGRKALKRAYKEFSGPKPTQDELFINARAIANPNIGSDIANATQAQEVADAFANMSRLGRVGNVLIEDLRGLGRGLSGLRGAIGEEAAKTKSATTARDLFKEANAAAKTKGTKPRDELLNLVKKNAKEEGKEIGEYAKSIGLKYGPDKQGINSLLDLPVKGERAARKAGRKAENAAKQEAKINGTKVDRDKLPGIYQEAFDNVLADQMLIPSAVRGYSPFKAMSRYNRAATQHMLDNMNAGSRAPIDPRTYFGDIMDASKQAQLASQTGIKGAAKRSAHSAGGVLGRAGSTAAGIGSSVAMLPLAEMAENGTSFGDATAAIAQRMANGEMSPAAFFPMLMTGTKGFSRRAIPGMRGTIGRSNAPHNAIRALGSGKRYANLGTPTENEGFITALNNIASGQNKEEEE